MRRGHDIELRQLAALRAVVDEGGFLAAADALGYTQSAISQQVASLERAVGAPVLDRPGGPRPATLTPVGQVVLDHARGVLGRVASLERDVGDLVSGTGGRVVCGTFQSVTVALLPDLVAAMRAEMPGVALELREVDTNEALIDGVVSGDIDLTYLASPVDDDDRIDLVELGTDPYLALLPLDGAPTGPTVAAMQMQGRPLIGQKESPFQDHIDDGLRGLGVTPAYAFRTDDNGGVQAMVRAGLGAAVLPRLAIDLNDPGVAVRKLSPPITPRTIYMATRRRGMRLPAAEQLVRIAQRTSRARLVAPHRRRGSAGA